MDGRAVDHNTPKFELSVQWCKRAGAFGRKSREFERKNTTFIAPKILKTADSGGDSGVTIRPHYARNRVAEVTRSRRA